MGYIGYRRRGCMGILYYNIYSTPEVLGLHIFGAWFEGIPGILRPLLAPGLSSDSHASTHKLL